MEGKTKRKKEKDSIGTQRPAHARRLENSGTQAIRIKEKEDTTDLLEKTKGGQSPDQKDSPPTRHAWGSTEERAENAREEWEYNTGGKKRKKRPAN